MLVLEAQSADEWEDVVSNCFVPLSCRSFGHDFHGRMDHLSLDDSVSVSNVFTDGTTAERTAVLAQRANSDDLHLSFQVSSRGTVCQGGRMVAVRPGSLTTYRTDAAYYLDYLAPRQNQVIVQVSRASLGLPTDMIAASCERLTVPAGNHASQVLYSYVSATQKQSRTSDPADRNEVAAVTRDLSATMIRASFSKGRVVPRTAGGLIFSMEDFIHRSDPSRLSIDVLAREFFVSRRRLYGLFEQIDTSPGDYVRRARLATAARMLRQRQQTIADIAAACGFDDATTFTRAFRREYGMTPREWRGMSAGSLDLVA